jgi:hypothetical protein
VAYLPEAISTAVPNSRVRRTTVGLGDPTEKAKKKARKAKKALAVVQE